MILKGKKEMAMLTVCIALYFNGFGQSRHYKDDYEGGYRGGYIKDLVVPDSSLNFLVIGDWGRCGEYFQKEVADQMANASVDGNAKFIISTGDNFYPSGVASVSDPLWQKSYEDVYHHYALQKEWYVVLGNHDYKTNPQAELDYAKMSTRWILPSRYYSIKVPIQGDTTNKVLFVFMDTNPFIEKYYKDSEYGKQVKGQDTSAQRQWLEKTLDEKDPGVTWKFVVGHHTMYTSGKRIKSSETFQLRKTLEPIFKKYQVDAYLCGHEHHLEYLKPENAPHYFISGAGSESREVNGSLPESKFKISDHGFMYFSVARKKFLVQVINWEGKVLFKQEIKK